MRNIAVIKYKNTTLSTLTLLSYKVEGKYIHLSGYPFIANRDYQYIVEHKNESLSLQHFNGNETTHHTVEILLIDRTKRTIKLKLEVIPHIIQRKEKKSWWAGVCRSLGF
jgi:hypothetical protein